MDELKLAIVLIIVVTCVMVATRPVTPRKRTGNVIQKSTTFTPGNRDTPSTPGSTAQPMGQAGPRRAIGRDEADSDGLVSIWPTS